MDPDLHADFAHHYSGADTDWDSVLIALTWTRELLGILSKRAGPELASQIQEPFPAEQYRACANRLDAAAKEFDKHADALDRWFEMSLVGWDAWPDADFGHLGTWLSWIQENANSVGDWLEYVRAEHELDCLLGDGVLDALRRATDVAAIVPDLVLRRVYAAWIDAQYEADERLRFQPNDHEALRSAFRDLDCQFMSANRGRVRSKCFGSYPDDRGTAFQYGQLGTLNHQLSLKRRQLPVRRLIQKIPQLLQALKPCFLMSPVAVSQYLPRRELATDSVKFDVVVFDEASQVFPQEAVPAIARAGQVVVVGDQKQLPPTSFFRADFEDEDTDEDVEDRLEGVESILDAMVGMAGTGVQRSYLGIHYRSRHEELIRYSNHYFYGDRLLTFPSPHQSTRWLGVEDVYLPEGRYDAGATRTNRAEAEEVVQRVFEMMQSRPFDESVGVVTLSRAQADLIEELINIRRLDDASLDQRFAEDRDERFFVKNLENVQGDERDHILLSIGYGPTVGSGQVPNRFGPINREGGERRLNVAVSRARRSLTVVRSLRPDHITSSSVGARLLRRFIEYAQDPELAFEAVVDVDPAAESESPFEEAVCRALIARGHRVSRQVGCFGYRIDLAISSEGGSRFDLGIECDGAMYHSSPAARDRDWLRQQVLEGLGWTIHRIWSTDWIKNPEAQLDAVEDALQRARLIAQERSVDREVAPPPEPEGDPVDDDFSTTDDAADIDEHHEFPAGEEGHLSFRPYEIAVLGSISRRNPIPAEPAFTLLQLVEKIVEVEGPVHQDEVIDRIRRAYGAARAGRQIREAIGHAIRLATRRERVVWCPGKTFLDVPGRPSLVPPRGPMPDGWIRRVEHIWQGEIEEALLRVAESAFGIEPEEAIVATARAFGFARVGPHIRKSVEAALRRLTKHGEIVSTETGLTRPRQSPQ